jgi:hypothetical protein
MGNDGLFFVLGIFLTLIYTGAASIAVYLFIVQKNAKARRQNEGKPPPPQGSLKDIIQPRKENEDQPSPPSGSLKDIIKSVSGLLSPPDLDKLRLKIEDYMADIGNREQDARHKYSGMADGLILIADHLEDWIHNGKKTSEMAWILNRTQHILEDAGIEQIKVEPGDNFNRSFHTRNDGSTESGTIASVIRQGYTIKDKQSGEDIILRLAEVTVNKTPEASPKS